MSCEPVELVDFRLNEEQQKELIKLTGEFLARHFPTSIISALVVDINFRRDREEGAVLFSLSSGCIPEPNAISYCGVGYRYGRRP
jgi:hypothetical protein